MHPYPLTQSGGLFLAIVGAAMIVGAVLPSARTTLLAVGVAVATGATALAAPGLTRPLGVPTRQQIVALGGAVLVEMILIACVVCGKRHRGERITSLSILLVVGLHFLPMAVAFGPIIGLLGVLTMVNAGAGLWLTPTTDLSTHWLVDGVLKLACGAIMLVVVPG
jgi:hypothetical protein